LVEKKDVTAKELGKQGGNVLEVLLKVRKRAKLPKKSNPSDQNFTAGEGK